MIGFAVAAAAETLLPAFDSGLFGAWTDAQSFALFVTILVSCSALMALATTRRLRTRLGGRLLEPVLASLTSRSRSEGAISGHNVDRALDSAINGVFSASFVRTAFPTEMDD